MQRVTPRVLGAGGLPTVSEAIRAGVRDMVDRRCGKFEGRTG